MNASSVRNHRSFQPMNTPAVATTTTIARKILESSCKPTNHP